MDPVYERNVPKTLDEIVPPPGQLRRVPAQETTTQVAEQVDQVGLLGSLQTPPGGRYDRAEPTAGPQYHQ